MAAAKGDHPMSPADLVAMWRVEIEKELQENSDELATARAELERTDAAHAEAVSSWLELQRFVERPLGLVTIPMLGDVVDVSEGLASALYSRLEAVRGGLRETEGPRGKARVALKHLDDRRKALLGALSQAERILNHEPATPRGPELARRPEPKVIEFDTIEQARA
jgi:hypothetical protein